jgi:threonine dehydrogenase-like Zn-dependent dehydrogenase
VAGAGAIGHFTAKILSAHGHDVTVIDRDPTRLRLLNGGIRTAASADAAGYDWIVEATGNQEVLEGLLACSATGATLLLLGFPYAQRPFSFETVVGFDRTIVGSVGSTSQDFDDAIRMLPRIDTKPFLQSVFPLERFADAWTATRNRQHLKVMLKVDHSTT